MKVDVMCEIVRQKVPLIPNAAMEKQLACVEIRHDALVAIGRRALGACKDAVIPPVNTTCSLSEILIAAFEALVGEQGQGGPSG